MKCPQCERLFGEHSAIQMKECLRLLHHDNRDERNSKEKKAS